MCGIIIYMNRRFRNQGQQLSNFWGEILVCCPQCSNEALVRFNPETWGIEEGEAVGSDTSVSLTCSHCALAKKENPLHLIISSQAVDPFFQLPLWLQTSVAGEILWAYNETHFSFLENYVAAELREHGVPVENRSLASRLPKWIKAGKNRDRVLDGLAKIRRTKLD